MDRGGKEFGSGSERTLLVGLRHCKSKGREKKKRHLVYGGRKALKKGNDQWEKTPE